MKPAAALARVALCLAFVATSASAESDKIAELKQQAKQGDAAAQYELGEMMFFGAEAIAKKNYTKIAGSRSFGVNEQEAIRWYILAAKQGHVEAQYKLGLIYDKSRLNQGVQWDSWNAWKKEKIVEINVDETTIFSSSYLDRELEWGGGALDWYRLAAQQGHADAKINLGLLLSKGEWKVNETFTIVDQRLIPEGLKMLNLAAEQGNARAQYHYGVALNDVDEKIKWFRLAAEQGYADSQIRLIKMYYTAGSKVKAVRWLNFVAEQGSASAKYRVGKIMESAENYTGAVKWYRLAAEQGDTDSQINLGKLYHDGEKIAKDYTEAIKWYRLAAKSAKNFWRQAESQVAIGNVYESAKNYAEAAKAYRFAAEEYDSQKALIFLGEMYEEGRGVQQNYAEAYLLFSKANNSKAMQRVISKVGQGDIERQYQLGLKHFKGDGVAKDNAEAYFWISLFLESIGKELTPAQLESAKAKIKSIQAERAKQIEAIKAKAKTAE